MSRTRDVLVRPDGLWLKFILPAYFGVDILSESPPLDVDEFSPLQFLQRLQSRFIIARIEILCTVGVVGCILIEFLQVFEEPLAFENRL